MNVVLVGAGAVGQVYGRHLAAGGAEVAFYVKPTHREELKQALAMHPLNERRRPVRFGGFDVVSSPEEVARRKVDQLWLCVGTHALSGAWLDELVKAAPGAMLVTLQPGLESDERLAARFGKERLVSGLITFIAWHAPLPNEKLNPPGIMYWLPPLTPALFDGPEAAVRDIVGTLRRGGMGARKKARLAVTASQGEAVLQPLVVALEAAGWSFAALRNGPMLDVGLRAAREALAVAAAHHRTPVGLVRLLTRRFVARLVIRLAPKVMPFDVETYFQVHFTKVGAQTRLLLGETLRLAKERALPHAALAELQQRLSA